MLPVSYFDRFYDALLGLPVKATGQRYAKAELISPRFLLSREAGLEMYYAPFHYLNRNARIVLVGLTPGWTQMETAFRAARIGLASGLEGEHLFKQIDRTGSFSGPMRKNLVAMLDGLGLNMLFKITSCNELFDTAHHLVYFTSAVSAPIFRHGDNYRGLNPALLQVSALRKWVCENLAAELSALPKAVVIPLGRVADEAIRFLRARNTIGLSERSLVGFPHPSGANGHRKGDFERGRETWAGQVTAWFASGDDPQSLKPFKI